MTQIGNEVNNMRRTNIFILLDISSYLSLLKLNPIEAFIRHFLPVIICTHCTW